jgi:leucyl aminopeptidase
LFCEEGLKFGPRPEGAGADRRPGASGRRRPTVHRQERQRLDIVAPPDCRWRAWSILGSARPASSRPGSGQARRRRHGQGSIAGREARDLRGIAAASLKPDQAAEIALGTQLRAYVFDRYKTKRRRARSAGQAADHHRGGQRGVGQEGLGRSSGPVADGVIMARDLINEPANVPLPEEFAKRCGVLKKLGVASRCSTCRR